MVADSVERARENHSDATKPKSYGLSMTEPEPCFFCDLPTLVNDTCTECGAVAVADAPEDV